MRSAVEPLEGNKVKVSVSVDAGEFEEALDAAFRKIAREVRIPGFRPGKAPRRILEARLGRETGRAEALRDALPGYYAQAIREHDVDVIAPPEIDITEGQESGPVAFDAVVEVRPHVQLTGYQSLKVTVPAPDVTDQDIQERLDRLRSNDAELAPVDRPARPGDYLTVNLSATRDGEPVPSMSLDDYSFELGRDAVLPELDERLPGSKPGEIFDFDAEHPDGPVSLRVLVKDVKEKVLPEVTDEWASDASEFDTVEELRADIVARLRDAKREQARSALRSGVVDAVVALVEEAPPAALVNAEVERRAHEFGHQLERQGIALQQFLAATGQSQDQLVDQLRDGAEPAVKADLALRAVADAEGLEVGDEETDAELARLAAAYQVSPADLRAQLERTDQMPAVRSDLRKSKALEWLIEHAEVVTEDGRPVDRAELEPEEDTKSSEANGAESGQTGPVSEAVSESEEA